MKIKQPKQMISRIVSLLLAAGLIFTSLGLDSQEVKADTTTVTITFDANADSIDSSVTVEGSTASITTTDGGAFTFPECGYTATGYRFKGWATSPDWNLDPFPGGQSYENISFGGDTTYYAIWAPYTRTISFDGNGGTVINAQSKVLDNYEHWSLNEAYDGFERSGYYFLGWSEDKNATSADAAYAEDKDFYDDPVSADATITLYAIWKADPILTFDPNGGYFSYGYVDRTASYEDNTPKTYEWTYSRDEEKWYGDDWGDTEKSLVAYKPEYTFAGWYTAKEGGTKVDISADGFHVEADTTLYAHWSQENTIVFHSNADSIDSHANVQGTMENITSGDTITLPECGYTATGYKFVGWSRHADTPNDINLAGTLQPTNSDFYAIWEPYTRTVQFDANGGEGTVEDKVVTNYTHYDPNDQDEYVRTFYTKITKEGYFLWGWSKDPEATRPDDIDFYDDPALTDGTTITLYAVWTTGVTLDPNGGYLNDDDDTPNPTATEPKSYFPWLNIRSEQSYFSFCRNDYLDSYIEDGTTYYFVGWFTEKTGGTRVDFWDDTAYNFDTFEAVTFYAHWLPYHDVDLVLDVNGGKYTWEKTVYTYETETGYCYGSTSVNDVFDVSKYKPTRTGFTFAGWYSDDAYTKRVTKLEPDTCGQEVRLYAKWTSKIKPKGASSTATGVLKGTDGNWYYFQKGVIDFDRNEVMKNSKGWWYVESGKVRMDFNGYAKNAKGEWRIIGGKAQMTKKYDSDYAYSGAISNYYSFYGSGSKRTYTRYNKGRAYYNLSNGKIVRDGKMTAAKKISPNGHTVTVFFYNGSTEKFEYGESVIKWKGKYYYASGGISAGPITRRNIYAYNTTWNFYNEKGALTASYQARAICLNSKGLDKSYTGFVRHGSVWNDLGAKDKRNNEYLYLKNGICGSTYCAVVSSGGSKWYVKNGIKATSFTGIVKTGSGEVYVKKGKVQTKASGLIKAKCTSYYGSGSSRKATKYNGTYYFSKGKLVRKTTVLGKSYGYLYLNNGKVDSSFSGLASNSSGTWVISKGKANLKYNGIYTYKGLKYYVKSGKVQKTTTGIVKVAGTGAGYYYIQKGVVYHGDTAILVSNKSGTWYVAANTGKLDFTFTGLVSDSEGTLWYLSEGKVQTDYSCDSYEYEGNTYKIENGVATLIETE